MDVVVGIVVFLLVSLVGALATIVGLTKELREEHEEEENW